MPWVKRCEESQAAAVCSRIGLRQVLLSVLTHNGWKFYFKWKCSCVEKKKGVSQTFPNRGVPSTSGRIFLVAIRLFIPDTSRYVNRHNIWFIRFLTVFFYQNLRNMKRIWKFSTWGHHALCLGPLNTWYKIWGKGFLLVQMKLSRILKTLHWHPFKFTKKKL
jgi:hypothetical protein